MIQIANPIYDSVFKYMMQNNKVCIVLLGALLKKEVVEIEIVNNEIVKSNLKKFAVLRLDFLAKVKNDDGTFEMVSIELQKSEKSTEIARFRRYLAKLYDERAYIHKMVRQKDRRGKVKRVEKEIPLHIVAIYILGHAITKTAEPVIYNFPHPVDADGNPIENIDKCDFFLGLTHNTIIVQIPYLRSKAQNYVEEILDIFDQSKKIPNNKHFMLIGDIEGKPEGYGVIVRQLASAAADKQVKIDMDFEDEYAEDIEDRIELEEILEEQKELLSKKDEQLSQKDEQLSQKDEQLSQKDEQLSRQQERLSQQNAIIANIIKTMRSDGKSAKQIAATLNMAVEDVERLIL